MASIKKSLSSFSEGDGYTRQDWDEVSDNPEWTKEDVRNAVPFAEAFPEIAETMRKNLGGRPKSESPKKPVSIRLDADVIDGFKSAGDGWQSRVNEALRKHLGI